jgi:hypothetical protein
MKILKISVMVLALVAMFGCESGGEVAKPGSGKAAEMGTADAQSTGTVIQRTEPGGDK